MTLTLAQDLKLRDLMEAQDIDGLLEYFGGAVERAAEGRYDKGYNAALADMADELKNMKR